MKSLFQIILLLQLMLTFEAVADDFPAISEDVKKAVEILQNGQGDALAMQRYHMALEPLANNNDPIAQFLLAPKYITTDPIRLLELLTKSASSRCPGAGMMLGMVYQQYNRTDEVQKWIIMAAERGEYTAQQFIGVSKWKGNFGFTQSKIEAYGWLRLAEAQAFRASIWSQIAQMIIQLESELGGDLPKAKKFYETLRLDIPLVDFHPCGQMMPGLDRDLKSQNYQKLTQAKK